MQPYIFIKDNVEGKSIAEGFLFYPQLVWVTRTEGTLEAAWGRNTTPPAASLLEELYTLLGI